MEMIACPQSVTLFYQVCIIANIITIILSQASLKKIMTMLGRVCCRQANDDATLDGQRPASSTRGSDFCKVLMVEAQRLQLEYINHWNP